MRSRVSLVRTAEKIDSLFPISDRRAQRFPRLRGVQLSIVARFAEEEPVRFSPGQTLYRAGDRGVPAWFLLEGTIRLAGRDGLNEETSIQELSEGQFTGELHQLGDQAVLIGATAGSDGCVALPLNAIHLRALIIGSAELGELIMRAFILRRVGLLERGIGPVLLGRAGSAGILRLQAFLSRNAYPHLVLDCTSERGRRLIDDLKPPEADLPLLVCACGKVLRRPTNEEAGAWLGITPNLDLEKVFDVAVIGAGPAGLAAAVYAASEGLSVLVVDGEVVGGQAGASARIENYLGFPTGISGLALTSRALNQAQKFGAVVAIPLIATELNCDKGGYRDQQVVELSLAEQGAIRTRSVVVASGARYKRPNIKNLSLFEGGCVHYWASPAEANLCANEDVILIGAGNSAGQAVAYLAPQVNRLTMIVRGDSLESSMSKYLIDRIRSFGNVDLRTRTEIDELIGTANGTLEEALALNKVTGEIARLKARHVFLFIGAEPNTTWLNGCLNLDSNGYVLTGRRSSSTLAEGPILPLQTSMPRVFAIGDVRSGSVKRIASAVGEGAAVVAQIHSILPRFVSAGSEA
jgi:thioredoxin reductase (NADPH)